MESHSKHGESIYWRRGDAVAINLYYASSLDASDVRLTMETRYPMEDSVQIKVERAPKRLALRIPGWCAAPLCQVNGKAAGRREAGYILLDRVEAGDRITLSLPMPVRVETMPDDPKLIAFLSGPLVLAGDLGPNEGTWSGVDPAIVSDAARPALVHAGMTHRFRLGEQGRPGDLNLRPFYEQHHNRTAVYFRRFDTAEWEAARPAWEHAARQRAAIEARTIDIIRLGEQQPEVDHALTAVGDTETVPHMTDRSRIVNKGYFEFDLAAAPGPMVLQVVYGGRQRDKDFRILIDGGLLVRERLAGAASVARNVQEYPVAADPKRKPRVRVRFEADGPQGVEVYQVRMIRADGPAVRDPRV